MHQLLHDLAVEMFVDLTETAQMEEAAAGGDRSDVFTNTPLSRTTVDVSSD